MLHSLDYGDVGHGGTVGRPVPMVLSRGYQHHVALLHDDLLGVVDDLAGAFGDDQDLVSAVFVKFIA